MKKQKMLFPPRRLGAKTKNIKQNKQQHDIGWDSLWWRQFDYVSILLIRSLNHILTDISSTEAEVQLLLITFTITIVYVCEISHSPEFFSPNRKKSSKKEKHT